MSALRFLAKFTAASINWWPMPSPRRWRLMYMQLSDQMACPSSASGPLRCGKVSRGATETQAIGSPLS